METIEQRVNRRTAEALKRVGHAAQLRVLPPIAAGTNSRQGDEASHEVVVSPKFERTVRPDPDGAPERQSYVMVLPPASGLVPAPGMHLVDQGERRVVQLVKTHSAGTGPVAYELVLGNTA